MFIYCCLYERRRYYEKDDSININISFSNGKLYGSVWSGTKKDATARNDGSGFSYYEGTTETYVDPGTPTSNEQDVTATYSDTRTIVYSVDITWGNMKFTYSDNATGWDPKTHSYSSAAAGWDNTTKNENNTVKIVNHSNAVVRTKFEIASVSMPGEDVDLYLKKADDTGNLSTVIDGTLKNGDSGNSTLPSAEDVDPNTQIATVTREAYVTLTGKPNTSTNGETIARVTVSIHDSSQWD